ncbi:MAG: MATE family efflux transporter, partial [Acidimicrobiia bacterium]|nr:MATE family efflux transporter [Acidimicrobiia bacterium]
MNRRIARLAIPALGTLAADPLVSLIDTAFVGRLGTVSLAALAINAAVFSVAFMAFNFLAYGTTPLIARAWGRNDQASVARTTTQALVLAVALGLLATSILLVGSHQWLAVLQTPPEAFPEALTYLRIRALAAPAVLIITAANGAFRGQQDTLTPLRVTLGLNLANVIGDAILIFGLGWGVGGAAAATVLAQWLGAVWFLRLLAPHWLGFGAVKGRDLLPL